MAGRYSAELCEVKTHGQVNAVLVAEERTVAKATMDTVDELIVACFESFEDGVVTAGEKRRIGCLIGKTRAGVGRGLELQVRDEENAGELVEHIEALTKKKAAV